MDIYHPIIREVEELSKGKKDTINWELVKMLAIRVANSGETDEMPSLDMQKQFEELVRASEILTSNFTNLQFFQFASAKVISRQDWIEANIKGFKALMEPLTQKVVEEYKKPKATDPISKLLNKISPFIITLEIGLVLGYMAKNVLGQYDLCLPYGERGKIYFVAPNLLKLEKMLKIPSKDFRFWIALHEVTHALEFNSNNWITDYYKSLLKEFIESATLNLESAAERIQKLDVKNINEVINKFQSEDFLFSLVTPGQREILYRIQALMTILEGYSNFIMDKIGSRMISNFQVLKNRFENRRKIINPVEKIFRKIIGIELKLKQYEMGQKFANYIHKKMNMIGLNLLYENEKNIPTIDEIKNPDKWINRVLNLK